MAKRAALLIGALVAAVLGTCAVTGVSLLPVSVALGPCLRDWTSPSSYRARTSPLATERFRVGDATVQVCYGRPSMRGRQVFAGLVPYDSLWRLGANEPTRLYTNRAITVGGITLGPGRYSLYALPEQQTWTVYASRSTLHWGNDISSSVRAKEVGSLTGPVEELAQPVETLTLRPDNPANATNLIIEWERTRFAIPLAPVPPPP